MQQCKQCLLALGVATQQGRACAGQGLANIGTMADTGDNVISNMCKIVHRDEQIPISAIAEKNIKLGCFVARHCRRISRNLTPVMVTMALIRSYRDLHEEEDDYTVPDDNIELDPKDWAKNIDTIKDYLGTRLGQTKIPLAYVVRNDVAVLPGAADPQAITTHIRMK